MLSTSTRATTANWSALLDIDNLAAVDSILVNPGCRAVFGEFAALTMRTGGELLFGRPAWQALYGEDS